MALFEKKQQLSGNRPPKPEPPRPKTPFEEKREQPRIEMERKMKKASPYIPGTGGRMYSFQERKKMINEMFPRQRFGSYISENEAKKRLREMRKEEYQAKTGAEKLRIGRQRKFLEEHLGLKGKY